MSPQIAARLFKIQSTSGAHRLKPAGGDYHFIILYRCSRPVSSPTVPTCVLVYWNTHHGSFWENPAWRQGIEPNDLLTSLPPLAPEFRITQHAHGPMKLATLSGNTGLFSVLQLPGALLDKTCSGLFFFPQDLWKSLGLFDINLCTPSPTNDLPLTFGYWREKTSFFP